MEQIDLGCIVYSLSGRDAGRHYCIVRLDAEMVYIADGSLRKLKNPKKKNPKHLKCNGKILESIAEKLKAGKKVFDTELASALREYNEEGR